MNGQIFAKLAFGRLPCGGAIVVKSKNRESNQKAANTAITVIPVPGFTRIPFKTRFRGFDYKYIKRDKFKIEFGGATRLFFFIHTLKSCGGHNAI